MPRLTASHYLRHRHELIELWENANDRSFAFIPTSAQRDLHDYFAPAIGMADDQTLEHRVAMTHAFPALPSQARRAFSAVLSIQENVPNRMVRSHLAMKRGTVTVGKRELPIRVLAVVRPKPDVQRLARALLAVSKGRDAPI